MSNLAAETPSITIRNNFMKVIVSGQPENSLAHCVLLFGVGLLEESRSTQGICQVIGLCMEQYLEDFRENGKSLEDYGIEYQHNQESDFTALYFTFPPEQLPVITKIAANLMKTDWLTQENFLTQKKQRIEELRASRGSFDFYQFFRNNFYRFHPYREPMGGYLSSVEKLDYNKTLEFFNTYYTPRRTIFSFAGLVNEGQVNRLLNQEFKNLAPGVTNPLEIEWEPETTEKEIYLGAMSQQGFILLGYSAPPISSPDYYAMQIINSYLGQGLSSKMWIELREKRGWSYSLQSTYPYLKGPSYILMEVQTTPDFVRRGARIMLSLIDDLKANGISENELIRSRNYLTGDFLRSVERPQDQAYYWGRAALIGKGLESIDNYSRKIQSISAEEIRKVARTYFNEYTLILVNAGIF